MSLVRSALAAAVAVVLAVGLGTPAQGFAEDDDQRLYLVTLRGPGTAATSPDRVNAVLSASMRETQQSLLDSVGVDEAAYQWTFTLNGFAARLSRGQVRSLSADPLVEAVQIDRVHPLASIESARRQFAPSAPGAPGAGEGTVIGFVDTGIAAAGPSFADVPQLGGPVQDFDGACPDDDSVRGCGGKILAAEFFVEGFGTEKLSSNASVSAADTDGHGTRMASLAAGNSEVEVKVGGERRGTTGGVAPAARIASYKACWSAPNPAGDGCATADVVEAVETAAIDGVDVLNLGMSGTQSIDTVSRALLGAVESGVVVVAPAGNQGDRDFASYASPWVISVGATLGQQPRGELRLGSGLVLEGAMSSRAAVRGSGLVRGEDVATDSATTSEARQCVPGSLDAAATKGKVVICERGGVARTDKSLTVDLADGVGMVLINASPASVTSDLHKIPTVHLDDADAQRVLAYVKADAAPTAAVEPNGVRPGLGVIPPWSAKGNPRGTTIKPDLVAPGTGAIAVGPDGEDASWSIVSGTSVSSARTAGTAATLLAEDQSAADVRSMLAAGADPLAGTSVLSSGGGLLSTAAEALASVVVRTPPSTYRPWLEGRQRDLNTVGVVMNTDRVARRRVTNTSDQALVVSAATSGFAGDVRARPSTLILAPGETSAVRVSARQSIQSSDQGRLELTVDSETVASLPVLITD